MTTATAERVEEELRTVEGELLTVIMPALQAAGFHPALIMQDSKITLVARVLGRTVRMEVPTDAEVG